MNCMNRINSPLALSPVHDALEKPGRASAEQRAVAHIADLSLLPRAGVKGPRAAHWLAALGLPLPASVNSWLTLTPGGLIARLGQSEYLVEGDAAAAVAEAPRSAGVYPVLRQDASFAIGGQRINELLLQTCNVDFRILDADPAKVLMTSIVGVSVTVVRTPGATSPSYRLWCDGTYGVYLWDTLAQIIAELGGGVAPAPLP